MWSVAHRWLGSIQVRPRMDAVRAVGVLSSAYVLLFLAHYASGGQYASYWAPRPLELVGVVFPVSLLVLCLVLSWRTAYIISWAALASVSSNMLKVSSLDIGEAPDVSLAILGLGMPLLLLLEVALTMEGGTSRARVVFRPVPLLKAVALAVAVLAGLVLSFSYVDLLRQYAESPEAATFQTAMTAGLAVMVFASILIAQPRRVRTR